jgi:hypothetical protein
MGIYGHRPRRIAAHRGWLRATVAFALGSLLLVAAACGESDNRNANRPPVPINISVQVGPKKVTASPAKFGAGPITLIVANQSGASQSLTIDGPRLRQSLGPINPEDTATLKVAVDPGTYTLAAEEASSLRPAHLNVGPKRPSAQNTLLLP